MTVKRILLGLAIVFVAIQFFRPARNVATQPAGKDDFFVRYNPPPNVRRVFESACADCHSNNTQYPWYANVQPVSWWLASHINEGKRELNFSEFGAYSLKKQAKKLSAISDQVTERSMPLPSYTWIHRSARLTDTQIRAVTDWTDALHDQIAPEDK